VKKISIHHYNHYLEGGAALAARRLFDTLKYNKNLLTTFYSVGVANQTGYSQYLAGTEPSIIQRVRRKAKILNSTSQKFLSDINIYLKDRPQGIEQFSLAFLNYSTKPENPIPDIIHLHWLGSFLDYTSFFKNIPLEIPIVWTLHDMNPFTGGCHYSYECQKYLQGCKICPQLGPHGNKDLAQYNFEIKRKAFAGRKIHLVADSYWLRKEAEKSKLFEDAASINCIHYGVDHSIYTPKDKIASREALGINSSDSDFFICFGADDISSKRKGMTELIKALDILQANNIRITCIIFGKGVLPQVNNLRFKHFGSVSSEILLSILYNAADLFIMPSLEEAFGQTCLEAMSCGVPVVAFDTGGIPDMVENNKTGLMAKKGDAVELAEKILALLKNELWRKDMSVKCREKVS